MKGFRLEGNVSFDNGSTGSERIRPNILIGGYPATADRIALLHNLAYTSPTLAPAGSGKTVELGYGSSNGSLLLEANYFVGGDPVVRLVDWSNATVQDNTIYSPGAVITLIKGNGLLDWQSNTWYHDTTNQSWGSGDQWLSWAAWRRATGLGATDVVEAKAPIATRVFVRPNAYEPGRALIVVYNWGGDETVAVNLAGILQVGESYELRNVQDWFGAPRVTGLYGGSITVPLGATPPLFRSADHRIQRLSPGPAFDVFIVTKVTPS